MPLKNKNTVCIIQVRHGLSIVQANLLNIQRSFIEKLCKRHSHAWNRSPGFEIREFILSSGSLFEICTCHHYREPLVLATILFTYCLSTLAFQLIQFSQLFLVNHQQHTSYLCVPCFPGSWYLITNEWTLLSGYIKKLFTLVRERKLMGTIGHH